MCFPQHRMTDNVLCALFAPTPAGPVPGASATLMPCAPTVIVGSMLAARLTDMHPSGLGPHPLIKGSATVLMQCLPAARMLDNCACGGMALKGEFTVLTGG